MKGELNNNNECHHVTEKNRPFFSDARSDNKHYYPLNMVAHLLTVLLVLEDIQKQY